MRKVYDSFDDAVADIPDGATIAVYFWVYPGCPQNLVRAVKRKGVKDLTLVAQNFMPLPFPQEDFSSPVDLLPQMKRLITPYASSVSWGGSTVVRDAIARGDLEIVPQSHGLLIERLRAAAGGLGGFYSPVGIGTILEEGKDKKVIDGKEYLFERPLKPDFGLIRAHKADTLGNLIYRGVQRGSNPIIAMASSITIAEVDEVVSPGEIDPEHVVTPGIFVDRVVKVAEGGFGSYRRMNELIPKFTALLDEARRRQR